ncbi:MAG TPA: LysM peptidoglycan-binding domain-containing protein [Sphingobacteriaceae bacterium]|nr:LysM peptidoglycan-binding domain-containing protein [Sphingobacteriaceae bacterium]
MHIRAILTLFYISCSTSLFAGVLPDSIGVENLNGKKIIIHKIDPRDTYYSISRRYRVNPGTIMEFNINKALHPGEQVKVPTTLEFIQSQKVTVTTARPATYSQLAPVKTQTIIDYKVGPKETLFSISQRFNTSVDDIKMLNRLTSDALVVGRIIKVRQGSPPPAAPPVQPVVALVIPQVPDTSSIDSSANNTNRSKNPATKYGLREITEKGVAASIIDAGLDNTRMLALHRTAPVGTIIKITNPMTGKTTFAKVVGKITDNDASRDAIVLVNKATADLIGALDRRFQVTLVYGLPNEQ